jgi:hypothetical protein
MGLTVSTIPALVAGALLLVALTLIIWAWRGKRIDGHPVCRRCEYDLFGLPAGVPRCPECGADLGARRAVKSGNQRKHARGLTCGFVILPLAGGWLGTDIYHHVRQIDFERHKPVWLLLRDMRDADVIRRQDARDEFMRRLAAGELSDRQGRAVAAAGLDFLADPKNPWYREWMPLMGEICRRGKISPQLHARYVRWLFVALANQQASAYHEALHGLKDRLVDADLSDNDAHNFVEWALEQQRTLGRDSAVFVVEEARAKGRLSAEQWARCARQAMTTALRVRPVVNRGNVMPILMSDGPADTVRAAFFADRTFGPLQFLDSRGRVVAEQPSRPPDLMRISPYYSYNYRLTRIGSAIPFEKLADGPQSLRVHVHFVLYDNPADAEAERFPALRPAPLAEGDMDLTAPYKIASGPAPPPRLVVDPALREKMRDAIRPDGMKFKLGDPIGDRKQIRWYLDLWAFHPPVAIVTEIFLRTEGRDIKLIDTDFARNRIDWGGFAGLPDKYEDALMNLKPGKAQIVLKPRPNTIELIDPPEEIWGEDIVIKEVEIQRDDAPAKPGKVKEH